MDCPTGENANARMSTPYGEDPAAGRPAAF
jgi:hypothetical protein